MSKLPASKLSLRVLRGGDLRPFVGECQGFEGEEVIGNLGGSFVGVFAGECDGERELDFKRVCRAFWKILTSSISSSLEDSCIDDDA